MDSMKGQPIGRKILVITLLTTALAWLISLTLNLSSVSKLAGGQILVRGSELARVVGQAGLAAYLSKTTGGLEGLVQEVSKGSDVAFAVFLDEDQKPLTQKSSRPAGAVDLLVFNQEIRGDAGKILGYFSVGLRKDILAESWKQTISTMIVTGVLALILVSLGLHFIVRKTLTNPLAKALEFSRQLGSGKLDAQFDIPDAEEFSHLLNPIKGQADRFDGLLKRLAAFADDLNLSAKNILTAVEEQATVAGQQSASVTEITSTMEEFSASSKKIAEHSKGVVEIANQTHDNTKSGAQVLEVFTGKMFEISSENQKNILEILQLGKMSKEISKVMEIINHIADQTKLIAFNAALEASSAGEAGRRFGVVASEIRRLADSVMESTKEIETKINEIQGATQNLVIASEKTSNSIQEGVASTGQFVEILETVISGAKSTTEASRQISLSTQQQRTASDQVVVALREIESGERQTSESIGNIGKICKNLVNLGSDFRGLIEKHNRPNG